MEKQTIHSNYFYLLIKINFYSNPITIEKVQQILEDLLSRCYGQTGGVATDSKVLDFKKKESTFILRCLKGSLSAVWSAVTLYQTFESQPCVLEVVKVSPWLLPLSNSDRFSIQKKDDYPTPNTVVN